MDNSIQNPFNFFDMVYLINLDSRPDRLAESIVELAKLNIDHYLRVSGVVNSNPALGCHLSHAKCYEHALQHRFNNILILEDDIEFFPNAAENLTNSLHNLPDNWNMLYLGANLDRYKAYQVNDNIARITGAYATHAYATRVELFEKLLEINKDADIVHNDVYYAENIHPNYNCYMTLPMVAGQRDSYSDIQGMVMSSNSVFLTRLDSNLVRI